MHPFSTPEKGVEKGYTGNEWVKIERNVSRNVIMNRDYGKQLRQLAGQMLWVSSQTRPDMAFEGCMMCNSGKSSGTKRLVKANKVITTMKFRRLQLTFSATDVAKKIEIPSCRDATHAKLRSMCITRSSFDCYKDKRWAESNLLPIKEFVAIRHHKLLLIVMVMMLLI